jgi:hypothetical protein
MGIDDFVVTIDLSTCKEFFPMPLVDDVIA